jgi:polar amino acid transport system substrate-binding protein
MSWIHELAPSGILRVCINTGNALLAHQDPHTHELRGISVMLAERLAHTHHLQLHMVLVGTAKASVAAVANKEADIGFFAIDPERAKDVHFTRAYVYINACYMTRKSSGLQSLQDIDQAGVRIVVGAGSAYDLFLSRHVQRASLIRASSTPEVIPLFADQGYEVAAGLQQALNKAVQAHPEWAVVMPPFMAIPQAMGCHPDHSETIKEGLQAFINDQLKAGHITNSLALQSLTGVRAASF